MKIPVLLTEPAVSDLLMTNDYYLLEVSDKTAAKVIGVPRTPMPLS